MLLEIAILIPFKISESIAVKTSSLPRTPSVSRAAGRSNINRYSGRFAANSAEQAALEAYPDDCQGIRDRLVLRGFGIHRIQVRLELCKTFGDKEKDTSNKLERAIQLAAALRIEE